MALFVPTKAYACTATIVCGVNERYSCDAGVVDPATGVCRATEACNALCFQNPGQLPPVAAPPAETPPTTTPTSTPTETTTPARPTRNDAVIAPSLDSTYQKAKTLEKALIPSFAPTPSPSPNASIEPGQIGVSKSFLSGIGLDIRAFLCSLLGGNFCKRPVVLANDKNQDFADTASVLINSQRPPEIQPTPASKDANLADGEDGSSKTIGNKILDTLSTSFGGNCGFFTCSIPEFPDYDTSTQSLEQIKNNPENPINKERLKGNVEYSGTKFENDLRAPDIKAQEKLFNQAMYPPNVIPQ